MLETPGRLNAEEVTTFSTRKKNLKIRAADIKGMGVKGLGAITGQKNDP